MNAFDKKGVDFRSPYAIAGTVAGVIGLALSFYFLIHPVYNEENPKDIVIVVAAIGVFISAICTFSFSVSYIRGDHCYLHVDDEMILWRIWTREIQVSVCEVERYERHDTGINDGFYLYLKKDKKRIRIPDYCFSADYENTERAMNQVLLQNASKINP